MSETFIGGMAELLEAQAETTTSEPIQNLATETVLEVEVKEERPQPVEIKSDEQESKEELDLFAKVYAKIKDDEEKLNKARRLIKANAILARPNINAEVDAFILEMAGISPFVHTIQANAVLQITFQAINSKGVEQVFQQWQRDVVIGRSKLGREDSLLDYYKAASSLKSVVIKDPRNGRPIKEIIPDDALVNAAVVDSTSLDPGLDLQCRRTYVYLRDVLLANGNMFQAFLAAYGEFETLMFDITYLLQEQPDFFRKES